MRLGIIVAGGAEARFFTRNGWGGPLELMRRLKHPESRMKTGEFYTDQAGRVFLGASGTRRTAMQPRTNMHVVTLKLFARQIADAARRARQQREFDVLAVVAPPRLLGMLRKALHDGASPTPVHCVAMDCTHIAAQDLPRHLGDFIPDWFGHRQMADRERSVSV